MVFSLLPIPLNGLSKLLLADTSVTFLLCWADNAAAELRTAAGRVCRVHVRARALEAVEGLSMTGRRGWRMSCNCDCELENCFSARLRFKESKVR